MHSHHSHSGSYISHGSDDLDSVVNRAYELGFKTFCLTEHAPRLDDYYLYPEEIEKGYSVKNLFLNFESYLAHAKKVQEKYRNSNMKILVGVEIEGIDEKHIMHTREKILKNPVINMSVGSVHFVNHIPIDFDAEQWLQARDSLSDKTTRALYKAYFLLQNQVITGLKPVVIGHFDLIRLFQPEDEIDPTTGKVLGEVNLETDWPEVWEIIIKNIKLVQSYGGLFELNSSAIRKGWKTPYPRRDICDAIIKFGDSKFCLSDDSHSIKQVGLNYGKMWDYVTNSLRLDYVYSLDIDEQNKTVIRKDPVDTLTQDRFWCQYK